MYTSVEKIMRTCKEKIRKGSVGKAFCNLACIVRLCQREGTTVYREGSAASANLVSRGAPYFSQEVLSQHHFIQLTAMEEQEEDMSREYHVTFQREAGT